MTLEPSLRRYQDWYAKLLQLYPKPYRERFSEGMQQTFRDLLRERTEKKENVFSYTLGLLTETFVGILKEHLISLSMQTLTKRLSIWAAAVGALLLIPLALTIRDGNVEGVGWNWSPFDFVFMGILLFGAGLAYELLARKMSNTYRAAIGLALATSVLLVWVNAAVGIIGNGPINLLYFAVLALGAIGALIARFRPSGMARALFAMAFAHFLVPVIALLVWNPDFSPGVVQVFGLNTCFSLLFVGSALLFRRASTASLEAHR